MKQVGRWTWMLLTLLLLLCGTVLAAAPERTSIELEQPIEMTFEEDGIFRYTLTAPIDGMRVQVEWLTESKDFTSLKIAGRTAYGTNGIYNLGEHGEKNVDLSASSSAKFPMTVRFVLHEYRNDEQEPNDVIPTELHDGDIVKFALDYSDWDSFVITTDKPGQDRVVRPYTCLRNPVQNRKIMLLRQSVTPTALGAPWAYFALLCVCAVHENDSPRRRKRRRGRW